MKKRAYFSATRESSAARTKAQILESAMQLFKNEGFDKVTISKIGESAQVSTPTVYALFKSKRGLLQALIDSALPSIEFEELVQEAMREPDAKKKLLYTAKLARKIYEAEKELIPILKGASVVSPELKELEKEREKRRYKRQGEFVKSLMEQNQLKKELTREKARDILWSLTGRDLYRMLVIERKWSSSEYEKWLEKLLIEALLK